LSPKHYAPVYNSTLYLRVAVHDLQRGGVTIITGKGLSTGGRTHKEVLERLARLKREGRLVKGFEDKGGAFQVWLLPPN